MSTMAASAYGHMILQFPVPFGSPDNSPLQPSGADFPCKQGPNVYKINKMNELNVGSSYELNVAGGADHGGGSCQLLVTLDKEPTKASTWKKIHVIEGACPAAGKTFPFTVPPEVPNGVATFGVAWYSRQAGQPELYMNCAPITVSGSSSDASQFTQLPDAEFANIQPFSQTCKVPQNMAATFANPGKYSTRIGSGPFADVCGKGVAGEGEGAAPSAPAPLLSAPAAPPTASLAIPSAPAAPSSPTAPGGAGGVFGGDGTCSQEGAVVCNGESQFGICNHGKIVFQPVAAGTKCQNGQIAKREFRHRAQRTKIN
ncbi:hypothetical protein BCR34DRAFT_497237 [Clohesyomyces aquaticus]|uniref:Chitin-binding type-4 domain-containing protein n=1 Tax=Clohesyomyces aquaticus TaxID=1231657 RepID=A0A1Y1YGF4_9PLEO|nr:hypothetical protein BCR34DRAFT_497237 [Clohesyomyces aquaticus]